MKLGCPCAARRLAGGNGGDPIICISWRGCRHGLEGLGANDGPRGFALGVLSSTRWEGRVLRGTDGNDVVALMVIGLTGGVLIRVPLWGGEAGSEGAGAVNDPAGAMCACVDRT